MSNPEQEKALSTISALAHAMAGTKLTDIQLDLLLTVENLMTNIAVQSQIEAAKKADPVKQPDPEFEIGEPVDVAVEGQLRQRATVTGKTKHLHGYDYQTSHTGRIWIKPDHMYKVQK